MVEYRKNHKNESIWLENFGSFSSVSQQTKLFVKPELMQRYEKAFTRIKEKYGQEKLLSLKKNHLSEQSKGSFSNNKSIKVLNMLFLEME